MKTTKSILITALLTLGTVLYAQESQVEYITASYLVKTSRFETLLNKVVKLADRFSNNDIDEPVVCMSYNLDEASVIYEGDFTTESWMTAPFETNVYEEVMEIESWMISPFETDEIIGVENWMTTPWI